MSRQVPYSFEFIYSNVRTAIEVVDANAYVTSVYNPVPPKFPAVMIRQMNSAEVESAVTMDATESISEITHEVEIYADSQMSAFGIADAICAAYKGLYFIRESLQPVDNPADRSIYRLKARFSRIIGADEYAVIPS